MKNDILSRIDEIVARNRQLERELAAAQEQIAALKDENERLLDLCSSAFTVLDEAAEVASPHMDSDAAYNEWYDKRDNVIKALRAALERKP